MAVRRRSYFKRFFRTGYIPVSQDYVDLMDSFLNKETTKIQYIISDFAIQGLNISNIDIVDTLSVGLLRSVGLNSTVSATNFIASNLYRPVVSASPSTTAASNLSRPYNIITTAGGLNFTKLNMVVGDVWYLYNQRDSNLNVQGQDNQNIDALATGANFIVSARAVGSFVQVTDNLILSRRL